MFFDHRKVKKHSQNRPHFSDQYALLLSRGVIPRFLPTWHTRREFVFPTVLIAVVMFLAKQKEGFRQFGGKKGENQS